MAVTTLNLPRPMIMTRSSHTEEKADRAHSHEFKNYTDEEFLAMLDRSEEDIKAGRTYTMKQVREMVRKKYGI